MITDKKTTQKNLNELMEWLRIYTPDERLEMLLEAARVVGLKELEKAIIGYWFDDEIRQEYFDDEIRQEYIVKKSQIIKRD